MEVHDGHHFEAPGLRQMVDHTIGELLQELAVVLVVQSAPGVWIAPDGLQGGCELLLELPGQLMADAAVVGPRRR